MDDPFEMGTLLTLKSWEGVWVGMVAYLRYYGLWHAVLVTGKDRYKNTVRAIHYGWPNFVSRRTVMEEYFIVRIECGELREYFIPRDLMRLPEDSVALGRNRLGETQFNPFTRRSIHMILECVLKNH